MSATARRIVAGPGLSRARTDAAQVHSHPLAEQLPLGRLVEVSGARAMGRTTAAVSAVVHAQRCDEPVVWIQPEDGSLFPPDLAEAGVDLDALLVVHVPTDGLCRAAELLLRSGAFGLVVLDVTARMPRGRAWQGRLSALAREHEARLLVLTATDESAPSIGPMVGLRLQPVRDRLAPGRFALTHRILRDKTGSGRSGGGLAAAGSHRAPWGLG